MVVLHLTQGWLCDKKYIHNLVHELKLGIVDIFYRRCRIKKQDQITQGNFTGF